MSKSQLHILNVRTVEGKAKATGNPYSMTICEAILASENSRQICEFVLPKDMLIPEPGVYDVEFGPAVDSREKRLYGQISSLSPARPQAATQPPAPKNGTNG